MPNFVAEAAVTPLPADGGGLPMEARMENEEGIMLGDVVSSDGTLMLQLLMKGSEELIKFKKDSSALLRRRTSSLLWHMLQYHPISNLPTVTLVFPRNREHYVKAVANCVIPMHILRTVDIMEPTTFAANLARIKSPGDQQQLSAERKCG
jgi:hypothetical protein